MHGLHLPGVASRLPASHQHKDTLSGLDFLVQAVLACVLFLQGCMRTYLFQDWFLCWWKLCLRDALKQNQALDGSASCLLQLYLFFVYRAVASQWWMGWEWRTFSSSTTSSSGIGPWRLQPQVSIKWYIINVPRYGFSGKTQQPYCNSISFQDGNLIVSVNSSENFS